ncbi:MAG: SGNH/GDSL hydrolase family protein [Oscillospiraceae bacterium]|nr:SGNH/GDSL hydrolase family protein [Oscillospiraceae bacterium]
MKKKKTAFRVLASALVVVVTLGLLQRLVVPKYVDGIVEGAFVAEYYKEVKDHDVIFVGDCEVYENFSPAVLWQEFGINSYIRGSAEQYIFQSYYLLEDAFRYEKPEVVVFNIQSLQFSEAQSEAYNRMSLEGMKWSSTKVKAIFASMKEGEHFLDYLFPILRYHTRWSQLESTDVEYLFETKSVSFNGYYMRVDVKAAENVPTGKPLADYSFGENAWKYLDMMVELCEKEGVELVLIKAPSLYPYWYPQWEEQVEEYAREKGLPYINFLELQEETGIDYTTDTYDGGLHMNLSGAEKLSRWLGSWLMENASLTDRRGEEDLSARWEEKLAAYEAEKERQYAFYGMEKP